MHKMAGLNNPRMQQKTIGANEDMFLQAFDSTPKLNIATQKKLENELSRVIAIISNPSAEWDSRVQAMKHFRSVINSGIDLTDEFHTSTLKSLEIPFQNNIGDLRSQVVRETCITIAFLSCRLQQKFSRQAEILLPSLIRLIPSSAKIVSTSALVALRFIIQSTHNSKLITIIKYQLSTSKSKDIHRALCEIAERIITLWAPHVIEKHINDFQDVLKLGICDSDELARQYARRAFNVFAEHFREHADRLFNSLDQQRQRMLNNLNHGGGSTLSMNGYGSTTSGLNTIGTASHHAPMIHSAAYSQHHHNNQYQHVPSSNYGPNSISSVASNNIVSRLKNSPTTSNGSGGTYSNASPTITKTSSPSRIRTPTARSTSAIDVDAQKRARARAVYLSSMYQRPRQANIIIPSPNKSNLPHVNHLQHHQVQHVTANHHHHSPFANPASQIPTKSPTTSYNINHQQIGAPPVQNILSHSKASHDSYQHQITMSTNESPNIAQQQQQHPLNQPQHQQAASTEKRDGVALSKAASYLNSVIKDNSIAESQIVTTIKYFNSLIEKHETQIVRRLLSELMPPLVVGIDNSAISVRKASVFAMVAIHSKVGIEEMESYLTGLTMTQRKLLEVYIKKFEDEKGASNSLININ